MTRPYHLRFREQALDDIDHIVTEIARDSQQNAKTFRDRTLESFERVAEFPFAYRPLFPDDPKAQHIRRGFIRKQPNHVFFFKIEDQSIIITRVLDARRDNLRNLIKKADT